MSPWQAPMMWLEAILESLRRNTLLNRPHECPWNKVAGPVSSQLQNIQENKPPRKESAEITKSDLQNQICKNFRGFIRCKI